MNVLKNTGLLDCDVMDTWRAVHGVDQQEPEILEAVRDPETFKLLLENGSDYEVSYLRRFASLEVERQGVLTQEALENPVEILMNNNPKKALEL